MPGAKRNASDSALQVSTADVQVYVGTTNRRRLLLRAADFNRVSSASYVGTTDQLIYTLQDGLTLTVMDLEENRVAFSARTYSTGSDPSSLRPSRRTCRASNQSTLRSSSATGHGLPRSLKRL